jgi:hypothetical protein
MRVPVHGNILKAGNDSFSFFLPEYLDILEGKKRVLQDRSKKVFEKCFQVSDSIIL